MEMFPFFEARVSPCKFNTPLPFSHSRLSWEIQPWFCHVFPLRYMDSRLYTHLRNIEAWQLSISQYKENNMKTCGIYSVSSERLLANCRFCHPNHLESVWNQQHLQSQVASATGSSAQFAKHSAVAAGCTFCDTSVRIVRHESVEAFLMEFCILKLDHDVFSH